MYTYMLCLASVRTLHMHTFSKVCLYGIELGIKNFKKMYSYLYNLKCCRKEYDKNEISTISLNSAINNLKTIREWRLELVFVLNIFY